MTKRSELQQTLVETKAKLMANVANRVFTTKESGLDGLAKKMVGSDREPAPDPELEHPDLKLSK